MVIAGIGFSSDRAETQSPSQRPHPDGSGTVQATQRDRLMYAAVWVAHEEGATAVTVQKVVKAARVSRRTFYDVFVDREECLTTALEEGLAAAGARAVAAYLAGESWVESVRAASLALLELCEEHPQLAKVCLVEAAAVGEQANAARAYALERAARAIQRDAPRQLSTSLLADAVVGGAAWLVHRHLLAGEPTAVSELIGPIMAVIVTPYLGPVAARRQLVKRAVPAARRQLVEPLPVAEPAAPQACAPHPFSELNMRVTYRTMRTLAAIAEEPGISNIRAARTAGIGDQGQASKLLARLAGLGLIENRGAGQSRGGCNEWHLTARGAELDARLKALRLLR
jgi:AcrR family transcriptional regulator